MTYVIICGAALLASGLTFFSGFGLGTILLPAFAAFFPLPVAIAMTAIVHFLNNLFKLLLIGKKADARTLLYFGVPSVLFAVLGAFCLVYTDNFPPLASYSLGGNIYEIMPVKLVIAILMIFFSLFELIPRLANLQFNKKYLPLGGAVSGFFGGLSGHQGALRSAFLIKSGLTKESFIATGVLIACFVDITRLSVYAGKIDINQEDIRWELVGAATLAAFAGAFVGNRTLRKVTLKGIQVFVAATLIIFALCMAAGII